MGNADSRELRAPDERQGSPQDGQDERAPSPPLLTGPIPPRLGRYRIVREIASGGMAKLYLAVVDGLDKLVALKVIHPNLALEDSFVGMFLDEARIASSICHRNVCSVFDFGECDGSYFIAMEYLAGQTLREINMRLKSLAKQGRPRTDHLGYVSQVIADACEGLHAAHETLGLDGQALQVVHRDVSPHNLFVTYDGNVSVVDFGIARAANRLQHTATGVIKGKFAYMAPEQVRQSEIDRRADVWSLGVCLWEGLTQERLFQRPTQADTLMSVMVDPIRPPSQVDPRLPAELDEIVMRALARELDERYPTARELGRDLMSFCRMNHLAFGPLELELWMSELFADEITCKRRLANLALQRSGDDGGTEGTASFPRVPTHSGARVRAQELPSGAPAGASSAPLASARSGAPGLDTMAASGHPQEAQPTRSGGGAGWQHYAQILDRQKYGLAVGTLVACALFVSLRLTHVDAPPPSAGDPALLAGASARQAAAPPVAPTPIEPVRPAHARAPAHTERTSQQADERALPGAGNSSESEPATPSAPPARSMGFETRSGRGRFGVNYRQTAPAATNHAHTEPAPSEPVPIPSHVAHDASEPVVAAAAPPPPPAPAPTLDTTRPINVAAAPIPSQPTPPAASAPKPTPAPPVKLPLRAEPSVAELSADGSLGTGVITRMLSRSTSLVRECYAKAASSAGRNDFSSLSVVLLLDETGSVREANVQSTTLPGLSSCVSGVMRRLRSDIKPDVGTVRVRFNWSLKPL
ncbi:MAG: protein kinase [Myxococcales bacterium]